MWNHLHTMLQVLRSRFDLDGSSVFRSVPRSRIGAAVGKSCELYKLNELNTARKLEQSWRGLYQHAQMRNWVNMLLWNQKVVRACSVLYILTLKCTAACNFSTSQLQKLVRTPQFFNILTSKCASRYSGVHFFHIATSKSGPSMQCFVHFDFEMCFSLQRRAFFPHRNFKKWSEHAVFCTFWLWNVLLATAARNFATSELQKVVRTPQFFDILTSKCASRYSGVHFFHIATSKSGPSMQCFVHFDFEMCFSLQRRAIFPHRNFKKWSETVSFLTFWLWNVLLATAACNFSTSQLQKVVRDRQFFNILTLKCDSRHSGVQFFHIATSKSGPRMLCVVHFDLKMWFSLQRRALFHVFSQQPPPHPPLYRGYFSTQPTHKSLKNTTFRDFPNISRLWIFFLLTFAQLYLLSSLLCHLLTLLLCSVFSTVHIVGS